MLRADLKFSLLLCLLGGLAWPSTTAAQNQIYLTRHAEKQADAGRDPALSPQGISRAKHLAERLATEKIGHVFATNYRRTMETAKPTAAQFGLQIESYDPRRQKQLVTRLGALEGAILIVGHSNTIPALVKLLGGEAGPPINDDEYGRLYVLTRTATGVTTQRLQTNLTVASPP